MKKCCVLIFGKINQFNYVIKDTEDLGLKFFITAHYSPSTSTTKAIIINTIMLTDRPISELKPDFIFGKEEDLNNIFANTGEASKIIAFDSKKIEGVNPTVHWTDMTPKILEELNNELHRE